VDVTTEFYDASESHAAAQEALVAARQAQAAAVAKLVELGQTTEEISVLCGITPKDVRELRRASSSRARTTTGDGFDATPDASDPDGESVDEPAGAAA